MNQITKRLKEAIETARVLSHEQQDLLAVELIERASKLSGPPSRLSPDERAELEAELAAARRGELATDADVAAMFARHGL